MEKHGSESYFVIGEGLLGESGGGRAPTAAAAAAAPRRRSASRAWARRAAASQLGEREREKLADADGGGRRRDVGDPVRVHLPRPVHRPRPHVRQDDRRRSARTSRRPQLLQARSPSLDLDSLYGAGPEDPESAKFYEADGMHLKTGTTEAVGRPRGQGRLRPAARRGHDAAEQAQGDHPRPAQRREPRGRPDPLRDDPLPQPRRRHAAGLGAGRRSASPRARELVTKHYQWMIRTDYLPRICAPSDGQRRLQQRPQGVRGRRRRRPTCRRCRSSSPSPRSGSGTRWSAPTYNWNKIFDDGSGHASTACSRSRRTSGDLGGGPHLPSNWIADFRRLYDFGEAGKADLAVPASKFNHAMRDRHAHRRPAARTCRRRRSAAPGSRAATRARTSRSATSPARAWCGSRPASRWRRS